VSAYRKFIDTLQSEPWTPTPPKPPKTPKQPVGFPVLGDLGTLGAAPLEVENTGHTSAQPCISFSPRPNWGCIAGEHPADGEHGGDVPLADGAIIAPVKWVERIALPASTEPGFSEPWAPRRGRTEWQGNILLHFCSVCGAWGSYGSGVNLRGGSMGRWFCATHRPQRGKAP
jgi:hypothetical protein